MDVFEKGLILKVNAAMDRTPSPESGPVLLQAELNLHPKKKHKYDITLTSQELICRAKDASSDRPVKYSLKDIVGCVCMRGKDEADTNAYLTIYSYPHKKKFASKKTARSRQPVTLTFDRKSSYNENARGAEQWRIAITALLRGVTIDSKQDLTNVQVPVWKKLLILINPFSGPGKALQIFQQRVVPVLAESGRHYITCITKYATHATEVVRALKLQKWAGIIIVSGDGLVFEVINGLMSRPDWEEAIKMPLGVLPGGSGNALCCAVNHYCNEPYLDNCALHSSFIIAKHRVEPMDLVAVDTIDKRLYSFLSVTWGVVADVDIESEKYRSLGNARFTVGAITRIVNLRRYQGRLSFLPADTFQPKVKSVRRRSMQDPIRSRTTSQPVFRHSMSAMQLARPRAATESSISSSVSATGLSSASGDWPRTRARNSTVEEVTEDLAEDELVRIRVSVCERDDEGDLCDGLKEDIETPENQEHSNTNGTISDTNDNVVICNENSKCDDLDRNNHECNGEGDVSDALNHGNELGDKKLACNGVTHPVSEATENNSVPQPETPLLPPLNAPVPENWVTIEDEFLLVTALYQTHLGPDAIGAPDAKLADGLIDLQFVRSDAGRKDILSMFLNMENAGHLKSPDLEHVKVKAFRLEPYTEQGNLVVDGESVTYGPIQAQVIPNMARIMVL